MDRRLSEKHMESFIKKMKAKGIEKNTTAFDKELNLLYSDKDWQKAYDYNNSNPKKANTKLPL